jgi:hypothetical protein
MLGPQPTRAEDESGALHIDYTTGLGLFSTAGMLLYGRGFLGGYILGIAMLQPDLDLPRVYTIALQGVLRESVDGRH